MPDLLSGVFGPVASPDTNLEQGSSDADFVLDPPAVPLEAPVAEQAMAPPLFLGSAGFAATVVPATPLDPTPPASPPTLSALSSFRIPVGEPVAPNIDGFMDEGSSAEGGFDFIGADLGDPTDNTLTHHKLTDNTLPVSAPADEGVASAVRTVAEPRPAIIAARDVSKTFAGPRGPVDVLRSVDLSIETGEFLVIMGPSGSGKTTLLHCLSGLDSIDEGEVVVAGESIHLLSDAERTTQRGEVMGFIFQAYHLVPGMTAVENVELPLLLNGWTTEEAREEATAALQLVGLTDRADHLPVALSGGEQQRVTIARALVGEPKIVWADEPTGNLDEETAATILDLLTELHEEGLTVVMVTHDETIAMAADRRVVLRDGRIVADDRDPAREHPR